MPVAERMKYCPGCDSTLPWSAFHPQVRWPDGTMQRPRWRCKQCESDIGAARQRKKRRENGEAVRAVARARYHRRRKDPEWAAARREYGREQANKRRRARGVPERGERGPTNTRHEIRHVVPVLPFSTWLREVMKRDYTTIPETAERLGMKFHTMRKILKEEQAVDLDIVERALITDNTITLRELYPSLYQEAA